MTETSSTEKPRVIAGGSERADVRIELHETKLDGVNFRYRVNVIVRVVVTWLATFGVTICGALQLGRAFDAQWVALEAAFVVIAMLSVYLSRSDHRMIKRWPLEKERFAQYPLLINLIFNTTRWAREQIDQAPNNPSTLKPWPGYSVDPWVMLRTCQSARVAEMWKDWQEALHVYEGNLTAYHYEAGRPVPEEDAEQTRLKVEGTAETFAGVMAAQNTLRLRGEELAHQMGREIGDKK